MAYMNVNEMEDKLEKHLKPERFRHSLGVAYTAASIAMAFGADISTAYRAGLLHDCAKGYSLKDQEFLCKKYGIVLDSTLRQSPQLMHSALAPYVARDDYGENSKEIMDAIEYHTTGKPEMTLLEQIIFVADYIEPNRKLIPGLTQVRKMTFVDLNRCTAEILKNTIVYLEKNNQKIDHRTIETYEYYQTRGV